MRTKQQNISMAVLLLCKARDLLKQAEAPRATGKVRRAIKSAEGALRHASRSDLFLQRESEALDKANAAFVRKHYPDAIKQDAKGFYYENADNPPARFYFDTFDEAAADLAIEIDVTDKERASVAEAEAAND